jgi:hypothetical protein
MLKKLVLIASFLLLSGTFCPAVVRAEDSVTTCTTTTQYNGSVSYVCGTHTPVIKAGIGDSIPLIASGMIGASGILVYFSRKLKKQA